MRNVWEDMKKKGIFYPVGGNANWCCCCGKHRVLKNLNIELPYSPTYSTPGFIYEETENINLKKDACTLMFIAALFTISKIWNR